MKMISTSNIAVIILVSYGSNIKNGKLSSYLVIENSYIFKEDVIDLAYKIVEYINLLTHVTMKQSYDLCEPEETSHHVLQCSLTVTNVAFASKLAIFVL